MKTPKCESLVTFKAVSAKIEELENETELHKHLALGYFQAMRGQGLSTEDLKARMLEKEAKLRSKPD